MWRRMPWTCSTGRCRPSPAGRRTRGACVAVHGHPQARDGALVPLVGEQTAAGDPRGVVDADVDVLPAAPLAAAGPGAGVPVAGRLEAAEILDVEVDHVAGMVMLVAPGRLRGLQVPDLGQAGALEDPAHRGRRDPGRRSGDGATRRAPARRHALVWACAASMSSLRNRSGRPPRSARPTWTRSWARHRTTQSPRDDASTRRARSSPSLPSARASIERSCASSSGFAMCCKAN